MPKQELPKMEISIDYHGEKMDGGPAEVDCAYVERGLAVTRDHQGDGWRVTHAASGCALGYHDHVPTEPGAAPLSNKRAIRFQYATDAVRALKAVLDLAHWRLSQAELRALPNIEEIRREAHARMFEVLGDKRYAALSREGKC